MSKTPLEQHICEKIYIDELTNDLLENSVNLNSILIQNYKFPHDDIFIDCEIRFDVCNRYFRIAHISPCEWYSWVNNQSKFGTVLYEKYTSYQSNFYDDKQFLSIILIMIKKIYEKQYKYCKENDTLVHKNSKTSVLNKALRWFQNIQETECCVCLENMNSDLYLDCKHHVCRICLILIKKSGIVKCPLCRKCHCYEVYCEECNP